MPRFTYSYRHGSSEWGFDVEADSWEDAIERVASIRSTCSLDGEVHNTVPAWAVSLGLLRPWCWLQDRMAGGDHGPDQASD